MIVYLIGIIEYIMNRRLSKLFYSDLYRYDGKSGFREFTKRMLKTPAFKYTFFLRLSSNSKGLKRFIYHHILLRKMSYKYGFQIEPDTIIGQGLYLGHHGTIIINPKAILGKNINIAPGVVIGKTNRGKKIGVPIIGNNVWIGANSTIVGGITIGNNVLIAPNCHIDNNVEDNTIIKANENVYFSSKTATLNYINNTINE
jgi:serine O-acetyltransferase